MNIALEIRKKSDTNIVFYSLYLCLNLIKIVEFALNFTYERVSTDGLC